MGPTEGQKGQNKNTDTAMEDVQIDRSGNFMQKDWEKMIGEKGSFGNK